MGWSLRLTTRLQTWQSRDTGEYRLTGKGREEQASRGSVAGHLAEMDVVAARYVKLERL